MNLIYVSGKDSHEIVDIDAEKIVCRLPATVNVADMLKAVIDITNHSTAKPEAEEKDGDDCELYIGRRPTTYRK